MMIEIKGVKRVRAKGRLYYYHRKSHTRLPGEPGSPEFTAELERLEGGAPAERPVLPGTLGLLIRDYRASPEFTGLAPRTRSDYQKVFDYLKPSDATPIAEIESGSIYEARDKAAKQKGRRFGNYLVQVLRLLFKWGKRRGKVEANPAVDVELIKRPRKAKLVNRPWKDEEIATVLAAASPALKVAVALGAHLGLREGDMLTVTWNSYDGTAFEIRQAKTGEPLWVPAHRELRQILETAPSKGKSTQIVVGAKGRPLTQSGFQTLFFGLVKQLRDRGAVEPGLSFHGLRHTVGKRLAEAGCDAQTIAAVLGQVTTAMAEHYSRHANRSRLARLALKRVERRGAKNKK